MNNRNSSALKAVSVALLFVSASAHAVAAPGSLEAWRQAKYPLLYPAIQPQSQPVQGANVPAPGSLEAWHDAKFGWLNRGPHEAQADPSVPAPGSVEAWRQAKYPLHYQQADRSGQR